MNNNNKTSTYMMRTALGAAVTVAILLGGWNLRETYRISGNRFTSQDGLEVWKEIARINTQLGRLPDAFPPSEFKQDLRAMEMRLDKRIDELRLDIHELQTRLAEK